MKPQSPSERSVVNLARVACLMCANEHNIRKGGAHLAIWDFESRLRVLSMLYKVSCCTLGTHVSCSIIRQLISLSNEMHTANS